MQEDQATRAMMFHDGKTFNQKHTENMAKSNPYKTKIAQASLSMSKSKKWIVFIIYHIIMPKTVFLINRTTPHEAKIIKPNFLLHFRFGFKMQ